MNTDKATLNFVSPLRHRSTFHFFPEGEGGGSAGGGGGDGGGDGAAGAAAAAAASGAGAGVKKKTPAEETLSREEAQRIFKSRDKARAGVALFADLLGIDPTDVEIVDTGDKDRPFELKAPGLDEMRTLIGETRQAKRDGQKTSGKWEERETELNTAHTKKLQKVQQKHDARIAARDAWIRDAAVDSQLRAAATRAKVLPEAIDDAVKLARERVKFESIDDESDDADASPKLKIRVTMLAADGTPLLNAKQEPADVDQLMAEMLKGKPYLVQAQFRSGPGAGGQGDGSGRQVVTTNNGNGTAVKSPGRAFLGVG
jgi:hypothetical protein